MSLGLTISDLPEFCGPGDLADCVISLRTHQRERVKEWGTSPISDDGIRRLIDLAYHASMVPEEGRFPTFRVVSHRKDEIRTIAEFDVTLDSVETLRRLAPAVSDHRVAIRVKDDNGPLTCVGLAIVDDMGFAVKPGRPEIIGYGTQPTFYLRVEGPGQMRASEAMGCFGAIRLSGGRIHQVVSYSDVMGVRDLLRKLAARTLDCVVAAKGEDSRKWFGGRTYPLVEKVLARILGDATDLEHGGAFVFLPTMDKNTDVFDIRCKYPAAFNLGQSISDFWCACVASAEARDEKERESAFHQWRWKRERLFSSATALSGLSAVDGCVVLNHNLDVLGFGGVIGLGESDAKIVSSPRKLKNVKTGAILEDSEITSLGLGTRHRSAFRLCKAHANSLVFVISQDGDLRVFYSDDEFVYGFEHLYSWVSDSDAV
jgi:DisA bacterial checkpoint controller nucleotide-binding